MVNDLPLMNSILCGCFLTLISWYLCSLLSHYHVLPIWPHELYLPSLSGLEGDIALTCDVQVALIRGYNWAIVTGVLI